MFGSRTSWSSGWYISTFRFPKDMHIFREPGTWKWQNRTPTVGLIFKKWVLYRVDSLVPIYQLPVPGGKLWMGTKEKLLVYRNIIFDLVVSLQSWCDPLFETQSATHWFLQHLLVLFFAVPPILSKPNWSNGSKGREFNLWFRNSVFLFPGFIKWKRPKGGKGIFLACVQKLGKRWGPETLLFFTLEKHAIKSHLQALVLGLVRSDISGHETVVEHPNGALYFHEIQEHESFQYYIIYSPPFGWSPPLCSPSKRCEWFQSQTDCVG